jgi:methionine-rich copper-binding protein CopC
VSLDSGYFDFDCTSGNNRSATSTGGPTTFTIDPTANFANGDVCTVTIENTNVHDTDTLDPPDFMAADYAFTFTVIDAAPTVVSTNPASGATNVAVGASVAVTFSEPVNVISGGFLTVSCTVSGSHTAAVSGNGTATVTFNPAQPFATNETCIVTVNSGQVTDADAQDPPDGMAADYSFSFSTVDAAPAVTSTTPTNGATNVAVNANIVVNFSESVSAAGAISVSCTSSGSHAGSTSAGPALSFTFNPTTDFQTNETCTVTVNDTAVTDTDAQDPPNNMAADYIFSFSTVDGAPFVFSTNPSNGATGVSQTPTIVIRFNEAVNVTAPWFTISCATSGLHTATVGGGPTIYNLSSITPQLAPGENCTVTVAAAQVTDQDANDPPDTMVGDFSFSFQTIDTAPSVTATSPLDGAVNVAIGTNIVVPFSEPVTVDTLPSNWIDVSCGGGPLAGTTTGGSNVWTFDPSANLPGSTLCTAQVKFQRVHDLDLIDPPDEMDAHYNFSFTTANANTDPVLTVPASPVIAEATGPGGATVSYSVSATDAEDNPEPTPVCVPASGSLFAIGDTTVNCSVTDSGGRSDSDSFIVRVVDTTDPVISISTAESDNGAGWFNIASNDGTAGLTIDVSVSDAVGATTLTCTDNGNPVAGPLDATGDSFVLGDGIHTVSCTAADAAGNDGSDSGSFSVDQTAPTVTVTPDRGPDSGTWYTADITFDTTGSDATSGVSDANCSSDQIYSGPSGSGLTANGSCTDDAGNLGNGTSTSFNFDNSDPTVTITTPLEAVAGTGWFNIASSGTDGVLVDVATSDDQAVTSLSCTDNGNDVGALDATGDAFVIFDGSHAIECTATDAAGNDGDDSDSFDVDQTNPTNVATALDRGPDHNGWYNQAVGWTTTGDDATSGIESCSSGTYSTPDSSSATVSGACTDNAGNTSAPDVSDAFKYDATAPTATVSIDDTPNGAGWFNSTVSFTTNGLDNLSGIASCTDAADYSGPDGNPVTSASATCTDNAGNTSAPDVSDAFKYDATAPTAVSGAPNRVPDHNGWYNAPVDVVFSGTDVTSGIASCTTVSGYDTDGSDVSVPGSCTDVAGNTSGDVSSATFDYDNTDPYNISTALSRAPDHNGWYNHAADWATTGEDDLSGIDGCSTGTYAGPDTTSTTVSGYCIDVAGNMSGSADSDAFKYDATGPSAALSVTAGTTGSNGWYTSDVTVHTAGTDSISSPVTCTVDQFQTTETTGQAFNGSCTNDAGLTTNATSLTVKLDKTNPTVSITSPATGYITVSSTVAIGGTASDSPSGIDTVTVNGGANAYSAGSFNTAVTLACGANTITATATDKAGRTSTSSITVTKVCAASLVYYQPLDQSTGSTPIINTGKMGRVIPVKVSGTLNLGTGAVAMTDALLAANGLTLRIGVNGATCANGSANDTLEEFADAGAANDNTNMFRWSTSQWIYNLDTSRAPNMTMQINNCYRLDVRLTDAHGGAVTLSSGPGTGQPYAIFKPTK